MAPIDSWGLLKSGDGRPARAKEFGVSRILLACDVDPILPRFLKHPLTTDIWNCLENVERLVNTLGEDLPPITWLIRSDESTRFSTGDFASGYSIRRMLWRRLIDEGHELGWHVHLMSYDERRKCFGFDPDPPWLSDAHDALSAHYPLRATRTGWDYGSTVLLRRLGALGIRIDCSALPGNLLWHRVGYDRILVDWSRCPAAPYYPAPDDYQREGSGGMLELPITQFSNPILGVAKRMAFRLRNGCFSVAGLSSRTKLLTDRWDSLPDPTGSILAFFFHPEDLSGEGMANFIENLRMLKSLPDRGFLTASAAHELISSG